jgi:hypothetical protein
MFSDNPKARYIKAHQKHHPEQNLHPYVPYRERMRLTRMNERDVNRKNIVQNEIGKLFNKPTILYKNIRNPLNEKFERDKFEKRKSERVMFLNLKNIPYYKPNQLERSRGLTRCGR